MTKKVVEKIEGKGLHTANTYSSLICKARKAGNQNQVDEYRYKLRGYLEALRDIGFLSEMEMRAAYLWYFSKEHEV